MVGNVKADVLTVVNVDKLLTCMCFQQAWPGWGVQGTCLLILNTV